MAREATPPVELEIDGRTVRITNPEKPYFPDLGDRGRKIDLVQHYVAVAEGIVRALHERPTNMQRFPEGVGGEEIYQKRLPQYAPEWIRRSPVTFPSGRTAEAMCVTSVADVAWAANLGCITFHPWHVRCATPDNPDEWRIDLDPQPGTDFHDARQVALDVVQPLLLELGYIGFPKTSGGRGIHVYVRIEPRWTFVEVRRAAIAFAREAERRAGGRVTTSWWKEERGAQVFIDYNQNARDRTIASAYSARARPRGTVSAPVTWEELANIEPEDFTIVTMAGRFGAVGDVHATIDDVRHPLDPLLAMAERDAANGLGDLPYPPNYPKMPGEPKRVQPSKDTDRKAARG
jgi:DNA ligase D-like protein (predicted polymerase)